MGKPRLAIFDFASCEGCQLQIVNLEDEILDLISIVTPVEWREIMSEQSMEYDIALVEGSITRAEDEEKLRTIRQQSKILVALGACATIGGVNRIKNNFTLKEVKQYVYGESSNMRHLHTSTTKSIGEIVKVDYKIHGCPIDRHEFAYIIRCLALGKQPDIPNYPVCVECKIKENTCRYEYDEICLGPVTRAGCDARCPSFGKWCTGCRGYVNEPNAYALKEISAKYNRSVKDLKNRMRIFGSEQRYIDE